MTKDQIKSAAIDRVAYRVAQSIQAAITHLEHAKIQLGYPGTLPVVQEIDAEGESLACSMMAALADDLPMKPRVALIHADGGDRLCLAEIEAMEFEVKESVLQLMGACDGC
jgi:hypothetical protein